MDDVITIAGVIVGFIVCLIGTLALLSTNLLAGASLLGMGLIIVAVFGGFIEQLFDLFASIFSGLFGQ